MRMDLEKFRFEALLALAGVITLISLFMPWGAKSDVIIRGSGNAEGGLVFAGAWLMIFGALVTFDVFQSETLTGWRPKSDTGLGFIGAALGYAGVVLIYRNLSVYDPQWGIYLAIFGCSLAVVASIVLVLARMGTTTTSTRSRSSSGGL